MVAVVVVVVVGEGLAKVGVVVVLMLVVVVVVVIAMVAVVLVLVVVVVVVGMLLLLVEEVEVLVEMVGAVVVVVVVAGVVVLVVVVVVVVLLLGVEGVVMALVVVVVLTVMAAVLMAADPMLFSHSVDVAIDFPFHSFFQTHTGCVFFCEFADVSLVSHPFWAPRWNTSNIKSNTVEPSERIVHQIGRKDLALGCKTALLFRSLFVYWEKNSTQSTSSLFKGSMQGRRKSPLNRNCAVICHVFLHIYRITNGATRDL